MLKILRGGEGSSGFSLPELLVATVLMLVAMLVASQILAQSVTLLARMAHEQQNVQPRFALRLLTADLENATATPAELETGELQIRGQDTRVLWEHDREKECLAREVRGEDGESLGKRCVLHDLKGFSFASLGGGLARVELSVDRYDTVKGLPALNELFLRPDAKGTLTLDATIALRGTLRRARW